MSKPHTSYVYKINVINNNIVKNGLTKIYYIEENIVSVHVFVADVV